MTGQKAGFAYLFTKQGDCNICSQLLAQIRLLPCISRADAARTPQTGRPPQAVRHQSRSDQPSSLITAEMSSVKTAEANRNRRQICALTPFRLASSCATISAEFGETFLPFIALPPKRAKSPYRWRGWAFRILAAAQLLAVMTAIAANSFRPNPTLRGGRRALSAQSAEQILAEPTSRRMFQNQTRTAKENSSWPLFFENPPKMHAKWEKLLSSVPPHG